MAAGTQQRLSRRSVLGLAGVVAAGCAFGSGCASSGTDPTEQLPDDQIVLGVSSAPGLVPSVIWAVQTPSLVVYGSGRVIRASDSAGREAVPWDYTEARIDPLQVARLIADAERNGLLEGEFGSPNVTDLGSTRVWLHGFSGEREVSVYALGASFDRYVSWLQRRRRQRLRQLIADGMALVGDAGGSYVPERVVVLEQWDRADAPPAKIGWPGPDPASFLHKPRSSPGRGAIACGELGGPDAAALYRAARSNPGQRWLVAGTSRVLAVNPLPIEIDC